LKKGVAVIIGTGSTACKMAAFLNSKEWKVIMISRNPEDRRIYIDKSTEITGYNRLPFLAFDVLINATPTGSFSDEDWKKMLSGMDVHPDSVIIDINYSQNALTFLNSSNFDRNNKYDGLEMLIEQAVLQFQIWTDIIVETNVKRQIKKHLDDCRANIFNCH
jgi:shikimate 5-dehydrogenase